MSFDDYEYVPIKSESGDKEEKQNIEKREQSNEESKKPRESKIGKGKKKKVKKEEENEGIRIANRKKLEYIFRHICNPDGNICVESLGKSLTKYKVQFKISELQQMIAICYPEKFNKENSHFSNTEINEEIRKLEMNMEHFEKFYEEYF